MTTSQPTIGLLGDAMLGRNVADRLIRDPHARLWSEDMVGVCASCDVLFCNLECCISERGTRTARIPGKPFFFRGPPVAAEALTILGVDAVALANNHALDYETEALADTLEHLSRAGIAAAGAGRGASVARSGVTVPADGLRVGMLSVTDHPLEYAASDDSWGVAYADLRSGLSEWVEAELRRLRGESDLVVAFPHWGPNMTVRPDRARRRRGRELVAAGADVVAGHSAHVFHGVELVDGRPVLYDLGPAVDDYAVDPQLRNDLGLLALWRPRGEPELELVGLRAHHCWTDLARGADADWIAARLSKACAELGTVPERVAEQRFTIHPWTNS
jgi:poly-gamma-glutamate capsule biosynthesis protein CapA/YwtB (metallophosphatase superfamily)